MSNRIGVEINGTEGQWCAGPCRLEGRTYTAHPDFGSQGATMWEPVPTPMGPQATKKKKVQIGVQADKPSN